MIELELDLQGSYAGKLKLHLHPLGLHYAFVRTDPDPFNFLRTPFQPKYQKSFNVGTDESGPNDASNNQEPTAEYEGYFPDTSYPEDDEENQDMELDPYEYDLNPSHDTYFIRVLFFHHGSTLDLTHQRNSCLDNGMCGRYFPYAYEMSTYLQAIPYVCVRGVLATSSSMFGWIQAV